MATSHLGCIGTHGRFVHGYFNDVTSTFALEFPTGRERNEYSHVTLLPSDMTQFKIYEDDYNVLPALPRGDKELMIRKLPDVAQIFLSFTKYWAKGHSSLKFSKPGSDFCDKCIKLRVNVSNREKENFLFEALILVLSKHLKYMRQKHGFHRAKLLLTS